MSIKLSPILRIAIVPSLVMFGLVVWALSFEDKMPDLVSQTYYGELEKNLKSNDFSVILTVDNKLMPEGSGVIINQTPAAGEKLPEVDQNGVMPITLTISPVTVKVPKVIGMGYLEAQAQLYSLGLTSARFVKITQSDSGLVLDQFPEAKSTVAKGTKITLTVAQTLPMPEEDDGCVQQGQVCICSHTGWRRHCNYGPHRAGLYCQCD